MKLKETRFVLVLAAASAIFLAPLSLLASGGGVVSAASGTPVSSSTTVTLLIPGVIGIDVESDITFDLNSYTSTAPAPNACQNVFPSGSACSSATYTPTANTTTAGATPAPEFVAGTASTGVGAIYLSIMDSTAGTVATKRVKHSVPAAWSGTTPGIATTDIKTQKAGSNNGGLGAGSFAALPTSATDMANISTIPQGAFNWKREDQDYQLVISSSENPSSTGDASVVVTYTFSRS